MPEVFNNFYTFEPGTVPVVEILRDQLANQFSVKSELEVQERGFKGAPRAFACLRSEQMQIWIFWEPDRPEVEISVDEPMERMIEINAALASLGGKPRYPDNWWKTRRRGRTRNVILRVVAIVVACALAGFIIWQLHWWGVLIVTVAITGLICLYILGLARSFSR